MVAYPDPTHNPDKRKVLQILRGIQYKSDKNRTMWYNYRVMCLKDAN